MYLSFWWTLSWIGLNMYMVLLLACNSFLCYLHRADTPASSQGIDPDPVWTELLV
jgi:hypothetical protein